MGDCYQIEASSTLVDFSRMPASAVLFCLVIAISDGDTLTARCGDAGAYEQVNVRIAGIDAPEKAQPFGQRSRQALADLCHRKTATIRSTTKDRYGRTVADVQCQGQDVGRTQVAAGLAWVFDRYSGGYEDLYPLKRDAQADRRGLWTDRAPVAPWHWRQQRRTSSQQ